jgi:methylenetetrahydrofolate dehydrogenase (NADP+)/methenyltetrahydrofolate cyclohydrolase
METAIGERPLVSAGILDGAALSKQIRAELAVRVQALRSRGITPRLDVIVAAQDPASLAYVRMKHRWAEQVGMTGEAYHINESTSQDELFDLIGRLNENKDVHGVLIQHPLPKHLDEKHALEALGHEKDVDGITPQSIGRFVSGLPGFRCATPLGMMKMLDHYGIETKGRHAVVLGRSVILGKPAALMLLERDATVTICHRYSNDVPDYCREADILVTAVGKPEMVKADWLKPGVVILDAGYNKVEGRDKDVGDVDFEAAREVASWITPVPGGVGPMTVASLLSNCVDAAEQQSA